MEGLDNNYFIISNDGFKFDGVVSAVGDVDTKKLKYGSRYLQAGRPMFFHNPEAADWLRKGIKEEIGDLIFQSSNFMISKEIRNKLLKYDIQGVQYYPAVYTDIEGNTHYDYYFVNIYDRKDWCYLERSQLDDLAEEAIADGDEPGVETIVLDFHKMLQVPEEERLIFAMSNIDLGKIFIHQKIKDIFEQFNLVDTRFFRVDKWTRNAHLRPD
jgi:hypothetical protein